MFGRKKSGEYLDTLRVRMESTRISILNFKNEVTVYQQILSTLSRTIDQKDLNVLPKEYKKRIKADMRLMGKISGGLSKVLDKVIIFSEGKVNKEDKRNVINHIRSILIQLNYMIQSIDLYAVPSQKGRKHARENDIKRYINEIDKTLDALISLVYRLETVITKA